MSSVIVPMVINFRVYITRGDVLCIEKAKGEWNNVFFTFRGRVTTISTLAASASGAIQQRFHITHEQLVLQRVDIIKDHALHLQQGQCTCCSAMRHCFTHLFFQLFKQLIYERHTTRKMKNDK